MEIIDEEDEYYSETLKDIGLLEYTLTQNYDKSAQAYSKLISLQETNYELYPKLIKAYYGAKNYSEGDRVFAKMKAAYENQELSAEYMEYGTAPIDEFEWNGQKVITYKYFKAPEETLDMIYKAYLLDPEKSKIERVILTEQTIQLPDGPKHLLCKKERNGTHHTYSYGWKTDDIDYDNFKKAVLMVFDGKLRPQASSYGSTVTIGTDRKNKKEKKSKKK